jgi:hypothetical protein
MGVTDLSGRIFERPQPMMDLSEWFDANDLR